MSVDVRLASAVLGCDGGTHLVVMIVFCVLIRPNPTNNDINLSNHQLFFHQIDQGGLTRTTTPHGKGQ